MLLSYLLRAIYLLTNLLSILIVARSLMSWIPLRGGNKLTSFLVTMTEPVLAPIRHLLSKFAFAREMPVDFSPVIAIIVLYIINMLLSLLQYL